MSDPRPADPMNEAVSQTNLHAPWRLAYLESLTEQERRGAPSTGCFLRDYWLNPKSDSANHVILREGAGAEAGMVMLNRYPYANGHLLVALGESRPTLLDYTPGQRAALWRLTDLAAALMTEALEPQGINIGVNQGRAAGAGVPEHLHVHLVPRWNGDTNFISVVGQVRIVPSSLEMMWRRYRDAWERMKADATEP